ncbi:unnamed protein product [Sphacelaria rigidula]
MPAVGVKPSLAHFKHALRSCENALEGVRQSSLEGGEASVAAAAAAAVPTVFGLMHEVEISPDDDCYALGIR